MHKLSTLLATVTLATTCVTLSACDKKEDPYATKKGGQVDLHSVEVEQSEEDLEEARKAAGHDSRDEIAAENAKMFEKGAREWIKTRMPEYRDLLAEMRGFLDDIEKRAPKWSDDAKFAKFNDKYRKKSRAFVTTYNELTANGVEGGNTQADLSLAFRTWEALNSDLGPGIADKEGFPTALEEIRKTLDKVEKALDDIEQDDTLETNPDYKPKKKKK